MQYQLTATGKDLFGKQTYFKVVDTFEQENQAIAAERKLKVNLAKHLLPSEMALVSVSYCKITA